MGMICVRLIPFRAHNTDQMPQHIKPSPAIWHVRGVTHWNRRSLAGRKYQIAALMCQKASLCIKTPQLLPRCVVVLILPYQKAYLYIKAQKLSKHRSRDLRPLERPSHIAPFAGWCSDATGKGFGLYETLRNKSRQREVPRYLTSEMVYSKILRKTYL